MSRLLRLLCQLWELRELKWDFAVHRRSNVTKGFSNHIKNMKVTASSWLNVSNPCWSLDGCTGTSFNPSIPMIGCWFPHSLKQSLGRKKQFRFWAFSFWIQTNFMFSCLDYCDKHVVITLSVLKQCISPKQSAPWKECYGDRERGKKQLSWAWDGRLFSFRYHERLKNIPPHTESLLLKTTINNSLWKMRWMYTTLWRHPLEAMGKKHYRIWFVFLYETQKHT